MGWEDFWNGLVAITKFLSDTVKVLTVIKIVYDWLKVEKYRRKH